MQVGEVIKEIELPIWLIVIAIAFFGLFFIYRSLRQTQLIELQIRQAQRDLKIKPDNA